MKRLIDLVLASLLLPLVTPIMLIAALFISWESEGSPFFKQTRVGKNGRLFSLVKLRTMYANTGHRPSHEVSSDNITKVGRFLRRIKFDELPQLWSVLTGTMTFVGPRPCLPSQTLLIQERRRRGVLALKPGITGIAQLAGIDMSQPKKLAEIDALYLDKQSLHFDLMIIARTAVGQGKGDAVKM